MEISVKLIIMLWSDIYIRIKVAFGIFETQRSGNVSSLNKLIIIIIIMFNISIAQISMHIIMYMIKCTLHKFSTGNQLCANHHNFYKVNIVQQIKPKQNVDF